MVRLPPRRAANRAGHDINYLALSGLASYSGTAETGPVLSGAQVADAAGSLYTAVAIAAAAYSREKTGKGCRLDIAMADCAVALNAMFGAGFLADGRAPELGREILNGGHVYGYYRTSDDRWLAIGWLEPKFAMAFFQAIEKPEWLVRAGTLDADALGALRKDVAEVIATRTRDEWMAIFEAVDACVEPVLDLDEAHRNPQFRERGLFAIHRCDDGVETEQFTSPIRRTDGEA